MKSSHKICIFTETYYPVIGGGETQAKSLAEWLVANGFQATVLTRRSDSKFEKVERYGSITVYRLPPVGSNHLKKWGLLFTGLPALYRMRQNYDLIFVSGYRVIGVPAVILGKLLGKTCILKADNNGEMSGKFFSGGLAQAGQLTQSLFYKLILPVRNWILRRADSFVAISSEINAELVLHGVDPAKIYSIPNSVDLSVFHPVRDQEKMLLRKKLGVPEYKTLVIYTGRLVSYKGLLLLLETWKSLSSRHQDSALVLVGSGSLDMYNCEAALKDYVRSHQLEESVIFVGEVRNVQNYLQAADIFVFPTEKEAFGISLIEAMASGLPVISTSTGGLKDIVEHKRNGLVIEAGSFRHLHDSIELLLSDPGLARELGQAALQTARDCYASVKINQKYGELFHQVISARHRT